MTALQAIRFGAVPEADGVRFQVWAATEQLELIVDGDSRSPFTTFTSRPNGLREIFVPGLKAGARYGYRLDGQGPFPDPASRYQPEGVHSLSEVVDPAFAWTDDAFQPAPWQRTVFYELHVGTFTTEGTFAAAAAKLPLLVDLGVTAVELLPLADAPGRRNWGYDGVSLYAPNHNYGRPQDLRRFVDEAHRLGLSVFVDAVYNHLGPDGAYHGLFHPQFYNAEVHTPWGAGLNFHGPDSLTARAFFIDNGRHWLREYHIDGFRLDATHAIEDQSEQHFLHEFTEAMHEQAKSLQRQCAVVAEDSRNLAYLLEDVGDGGYGLDGVWADDFHHHVRRALAGDTAGYYADFSGTPADIAQTMRQGWFFEGQVFGYSGAARGTPTGTIDRSRFVICIQNHDQVGNRARGERLHHQISAASYRAASALLLLAPETPLLFMGQEWAASSPFLFFTDHNEELGRLVTEGRRREFSRFPEFADPAQRSLIPDPQAESTFTRSKLVWSERTQGEHALMWRWYQRLLQLRRELRDQSRTCEVREQQGAITLAWRGPSDTILAVVALHGPLHWTAPSSGWQLVLPSESPDFTSTPEPIDVNHTNHTLRLTRAGCIILRL